MYVRIFPKNNQNVSLFFVIIFYNFSSNRSSEDRKRKIESVLVLALEQNSHRQIEKKHT